MKLNFVEKINGGKTNNMRSTLDEYYLDIARAVSRRSTCLRRQYGAVIVNNGEIIATGYNGSPRGEKNCCDNGTCKRIGHAHNDGDYDECRSVHAEMNAIISASRRDMLGSTLYLAGFENGQEIAAEPCPICNRIIKNAGIENVVFTKKST
jgi:dCMP deaminase